MPLPHPLKETLLLLLLLLNDTKTMVTTTKMDSYNNACAAHHGHWSRTYFYSIIIHVSYCSNLELD